MTTSSKTVVLSTPARLHFGFLDLGPGKEGAVRRRFGGLGMTLGDCGVRLAARPAVDLRIEGVEGADLATVRQLARRFLRFRRWSGGARIRIEGTIPRHAGLGSGTQMALAVGAVLTALRSEPIDPQSIAAALGRGRRSGIGIGAFERGGVLVDGGSWNEDPSPIIVSHPWPVEWRVVLIFDDSRRGVHGDEERAVFSAIPPYGPGVRDHLCRTVLIETLPSLVEKRFESFARSITEIQNIVGDHFARYQGARYASPRIAAILDDLAHRGWQGYGQSSWGPTAFVLCPNAPRARSVVEGIRRRHDDKDLRLSIHRGRNRGHRMVRDGARPLQIDPALI